MKRCNFVDAVRGAAVVPMVVNHTAHYWLAASVGASSLFYLTETTAAPLFLFIAGFSLVLSWSEMTTTRRAWMVNAALRAVFLMVLGYFLNLVLFPGHLLFLMGPLQTIGLSILLLIPVLPYLGSAWVSLLLMLMSLASYGVFAWQAKPLAAFIMVHPAWGEILFFSMPPWPWAAFVAFGAALGGRWCAAPNNLAREAVLQFAALWGVLGVIIGLFANGFFGWMDYAINYPGFTTWVPGPGTAFWITGLIPVVLFISYKLQEWQRLPRWLLNFGRSALLIYVVHRLFVILIMAKLLHFTVAAVWAFIVVNLLLLFALGELAKLRNTRNNMLTVAQHRT